MTTVDMTSVRALQVRVEGVVQGVGFRDYARRRARALGLRGYVRNLPDGSVEAAAEGPAQALESFLTDLRRGPPSSRVLDCRAVWGEAAAGFDDFRIRY